MAYQHYSDSEIRALKDLTIREVSAQYYEAHRNRIAPVITGSRGGFVHQYHILMFRCDKCGRYFEYRDDLRPRPFEEYERKKYCRECWETEQHRIMVPCRDCGLPVTLYMSRHQFKGRFRACWIKRLFALRQKYSAYRPLLENILREKGIELEPVYADGLDETGRPDRPVEDLKLGLPPLRENEYALYLMNAGGGVLAFPDNGISLRYIKAPSAKRVLEAADSGEYLLAAGTDGKDIYSLTGKGDLYSSNEDVLKGEQQSSGAGRMDRLLGKKRSRDLQPVRIIDPVEFCLRTAGSYFTEEQMAAAVREFCSHGIAAVSSNTYYDPQAQKFFKVLTDGNYYHGYDVEYLQKSKDEVLQEHVAFHFSIDQFVDACEAEQVPLLAILSRLPYAGGEYSPPDNFGYGTHFV